MSGGFNPSPMLFGGQAGHVEQALLQDLLDADGSGLAKDADSYVYAERMAEARVLSYLHKLFRRMSLQTDVARTTDFLARWETILGVRLAVGSSEAQRRAALVLHERISYTMPISSFVEFVAESIVGDAFIEIVRSTADIANTTTPGGAVVPGGATLGDDDFRSTVAHVAVKVAQPANMADADFYALMGELSAALDAILPMWCTFDWFREGPFGPGFYEDDEHNLDNEAFDE